MITMSIGIPPKSPPRSKRNPKRIDLGVKTKKGSQSQDIGHPPVKTHLGAAGCWVPKMILLAPPPKCLSKSSTPGWRSRH